MKKFINLFRFEAMPESCDVPYPEKTLYTINFTLIANIIVHNNLHFCKRLKFIK